MTLNTPYAVSPVVKNRPFLLRYRHPSALLDTTAREAIDDPGRPIEKMARDNASQGQARNSIRRYGGNVADSYSRLA
jgi:hypothetical protein